MSMYATSLALLLARLFLLQRPFVSFALPSLASHRQMPPKTIPTLPITTEPAPSDPLWAQKSPCSSRGPVSARARQAVPAEALKIDLSLPQDPRDGRDAVADAVYLPSSAEAASRAEEKIRIAKALKGIGILDSHSAELAIAARRQEKRQQMFSKPISISFVIHALRLQYAARRLGNEAFLFIPFFAFFLGFLVTQMQTEASYWAVFNMGDQALNGQDPSLESTRIPLLPGETGAYHISVTFGDTKNADMWHHWFETQLVNWYFDNPQTGVTINNWVHGGGLRLYTVRVRTLRVRNNTCNPNNFFYNRTAYDPTSPSMFYNGACYGEFSLDNVDSTSYGIPGDDPALFQYVSCKSPSRFIQGELAYYPCNGNLYEIPVNLSQSDATSMAQRINYGWNGQLGDVIQLKSTRFIAAEMLFYVPFTDSFTLVKAVSEISASGSWNNFVKRQGFYVYSSRQISPTVLFIFLYVGVFAYLLKFIYDIVLSFVDHKFLQFVGTMWNWIELFNLGAFYVVFVTRIMWWHESLNLNFQLPATGKYDERIDYIAWLVLFQQYGLAFNSVFMFLKILRFVELNPQLNIVTRTLARAGGNLIGILVVFVVILVSYSLSGVALFSNGLFDFKDFESAFTTLLRYLIGDFDYPALREENRVLAGFFFWTFIILGLYLLLNFFIGVIGSSFDKERELTKAEKLHSTIYRFLKRFVNSVKDFVSSPRQIVAEWLESRRNKFAEEGKLRIFLRILSTHRESLPPEVDEETLAEMTREEREAVMPDPPITLGEIEQIFAEVDPAEGKERYAWMTEKYVTLAWTEVHRQYCIEKEDEEEEAHERLCVRVEQATEQALRHVLGIKIVAEKRSSLDVLAVQDLFAPTAQTMRSIGQMTECVSRTDDQLAKLLKSVVQLDNQLSALLPK